MKKQVIFNTGCFIHIQKFIIYLAVVQKNKSVKN